MFVINRDPVISAYNGRSAQLDLHDYVDRSKRCPIDNTSLVFRGDEGDYECISCNVHYAAADAAAREGLVIAAREHVEAVKELLSSEEFEHGQDGDHLGWIVNQAIQNKLLPS